MSGFSVDWLALREPFDAAARRASVAALDLPALARRLRGGDAVLEVVDLGCGTGANLRVLAPALGGAQRWWMVDHDLALLAALPAVLAPWAAANGAALREAAGRLSIEAAHWCAEVRPLQVDLAAAPEVAPLAAARLVTASALLDLVSAPWLDALTGRIHASRAAMLFALTVDGRIAWEPVDADDAGVGRLFAAHQRRDKGFGAALGGEAVERVAQRLAALGCDVRQVPADWRIDARDGTSATAMLHAMVEGVAAAAAEQAPIAHDLVEAWKQRRLAALGHSRLCVGHQDTLATPGPPSA